MADVTDDATNVENMVGTDAKDALNGEEYCETDGMTKESCEASTCCHWNTWEEGDASNFGAGRCWSSIGQDLCTDMADVTEDALANAQMATVDEGTDEVRSDIEDPDVGVEA